jgi:O-antigen/teichoic acid export membrane protein
MNFLYLGPSLGGGVLALIIGFFVSTFLFFVAIFIKPIKYLIGLIKKKQH